MKTTPTVEVRPAQEQSSANSTRYHDPRYEEHGHPRRPPARVPPALTHGLRATATIVLPTEDAAEFAALRHDMFGIYQPRTRDEANCVEMMARCYWRIERCQALQAAYDARAIALAHGDPAHAAGEPGVERHCVTDPHRWQHKSMDCELLEGRLDRRMTRTRDKLLQLQWARRNHLIPGAIDCMADYRDFERAGAVTQGLAVAAEGGPVEGAFPEGTALPSPADGPAIQGASDSSDGGNGIGSNWNPAAAPVPADRPPQGQRGTRPTPLPRRLPALPPAMPPVMTQGRAGIPNRPGVLRSQTVPFDARRPGNGGPPRNAIGLPASKPGDSSRKAIDRSALERPGKGRTMKATP